MSSVAEIRQHIKVVGDMAKITRAMYLISSSKMRKALRMYEQNMIFFQQMRSDLRYILDNMSEFTRNPYYREHGNRAGYVVIAGDKGMCGGYNSEVLKLARTTIEDGRHEQKALFPIGSVASEYFSAHGMHPDVHYNHVIQNPNLRNAREITAQMCHLFRSKVLDEVYVIYTSEGRDVRLPQVRRLLPVLRADFDDVEPLSGARAPLAFHPSADEVFESIIPHYLTGIFYSALVQSYAAEHHARMMAMDAATRNAAEMGDQLRLHLNHARQSLITQEINEIISGIPAEGGAL